MYPEHEIELSPGATVVLYTDGLIEERGTPIDDGMARLVDAVRSGPEQLDALCDHVLNAVLGGQPTHDDVAVLALRLATATAGTLRLELSAEPAVLVRVRRSLEQWLAAAGADEGEIFDITVASGEACANVIEHAYGPADASFEVEASTVNGSVQIEILDRGSWRPPRGNDRGRGIMLMNALMEWA